MIGRAGVMLVAAFAVACSGQAPTSAETSTPASSPAPTAPAGGPTPAALASPTSPAAGPSASPPPAQDPHPVTPDASAPAPTADVDATGGSADAGAPTPNADSAAAATGAAASEAARAVPATGVYASAEDALLVYVEGKRTRDPERLWSVMPDAARKVVSDTLVRTRSAPADQLAKAGLTPADLEAMTPRAFFDFLVNRAPPPAPTPPVSALTTIPDGDTRARVTYKLGAQACDANTVKDGEGWKVEVARCAP